MLWPSSSTTRRTTSCVTVPPLSASARKALKAEANWIERSTTADPGGASDVSWNDPVTRRGIDIFYGSSHQITSEAGTTVQGSTSRTVWVTYATRTWTASTQHVARSGQPQNVESSSERYRTMIANGYVKIIGAPTLDGQHTLLLQQSVPPPSPSTLSTLRKQLQLPLGAHLSNQALKKIAASFKKAAASVASLRSDTWVNALTYLPVQTSLDVHGQQTETDTITWIPRTPATIAKTALVIPTGFTQPPPQPGIFTSWNTVGVVSQPSRCHA